MLLKHSKVVTILHEGFLQKFIVAIRLWCL